MKLNFNQKAELITKTFCEESFAQFSKLCVDAVRGNVEGYSVQQANAAIREKMCEVAGLPANPTAYEVKKAMQKTHIREAVFEIIWQTLEDTLVSGWQNDPFFMRYVEIKMMALGQTNRFYIADNVDLMISEISASNHNITRQRLGAGQEFGVKVKEYGAKVYMEAERYLMGVEDWGALINKLTLAYTRLINTELHDAVMSAGAQLPSPGQWNKTGALASANHDEFLTLINDVAIATGTSPIIMGTKVALNGLRNLGDIDWVSAEAKADVYRTGRIGTFEGTELAEIPQAFAPNDSSTYLVDDKKIMIMPGNIDQFVKMYYEGDSRIKEVTDRNVNYDNTYEYELCMKFGIAVLTNVRFGTWNIA